VVSKPKLPLISEGPFRITDSRFVEILPYGSLSFCALDFSTKETINSSQPAFDVLGPYYVAQPNLGEVGLYERGKGIKATVKLHSE
jgi:hypothetical protein